MAKRSARRLSGARYSTGSTLSPPTTLYSSNARFKGLSFANSWKQARVGFEGEDPYRAGATRAIRAAAELARVAFRVAFAYNGDPARGLVD